MKRKGLSVVRSGSVVDRGSGPVDTIGKMTKGQRESEEMMKVTRWLVRKFLSLV